MERSIRGRIRIAAPDLTEQSPPETLGRLVEGLHETIG